MNLWTIVIGAVIVYLVLMIIIHKIFLKFFKLLFFIILAGLAVTAAYWFLKGL